MGLPILMLMLLQVPTSVATRVVEPRESPVSLVGLPCGEPAAKVLATRTADADQADASLQSEPFQCGPRCRVGVRPKTGATIDSVIVISAVAHDRGRIVATPSPWMKPSAQSSCGGELVVDASMPKTGWPIVAVFYFVSDVKFQDGTTWSLDPDGFTKAALAKWFLQPKRGQ